MKILFISNSASRTGAPIGLLHLLQWLRANTDVTFEVLLRVGGGDLQSEFEKLCAVTVYGDLWSNQTVPQRLARRMGWSSFLGQSCMSPVESLCANKNFDLIYSNTITNGGIIAELSRLDVPILCHVHELESVIEKYGADNLAHHQRHCRHFIADSRATQRNLVKRHEIPSRQVALAYEFIDVHAVHTAQKTETDIAIDADGRFVVGGCGYSYQRKGKDLFARLAREVISRDATRAYHFVWVGGEPDGPEAEKFRADITRLDLSADLTFVPQVDDTYPYFQLFDAFALTSREEPLGMVMLEAACFECPVLCFGASGGAPEFVGDDAGFTIPGLSIEEMAERIIALASDDALRKRLGAGARAKVEARHDITVVPQKILSIIESVLETQTVGKG